MFVNIFSLQYPNRGHGSSNPTFIKIFSEKKIGLTFAHHFVDTYSFYRNVKNKIKNKKESKQVIITCDIRVQSVFITSGLVQHSLSFSPRAHEKMEEGAVLAPSGGEDSSVLNYIWVTHYLFVIQQ